VRQVPTGRGPHPRKRDQPWLEDDKVVRDIFNALPAPFNLVFYVGNHSGLRLGELCGLRMSELGFLSSGVVRARFSYDGCLKEDKRSEGKTKWAPAADDYDTVLGAWLARRRAEGAQPEDLMFPPPVRVTKKGRVLVKGSTPEARKQWVEDAWNAARKKLGLTLTFYQATRHSFVSRNRARGVSLDEASAAVGHSSPEVTKRYYDHHEVKAFSAIMRLGLGLGADKGGTVTPITQAL